MTVAEGGGRRAVMSKLRDMYVPTLKANYAVWPAVQVINFRLMPVQFQLVSTIPPRSIFAQTCRLLSCMSSPLCLPLVSPGLLTCPSPMLLRRQLSQTQPRSAPTTSGWSKIGTLPRDKRRIFPCLLALLNGVSYIESGRQASRALCAALVCLWFQTRAESWNSVLRIISTALVGLFCLLERQVIFFLRMSDVALKT